MDRRSGGSITIYLSLIFTIVLALLCTIIESARIYAVNAKIKGVTYIAAESVCGQYAREVFDRYGLMMYWDNGTLENDLSQYINSNLEINEITGTDSTDLYGIHLSGIEAGSIMHAADDNGKALMQQIAEYMRYKSVGEGIDKLLEWFGIYEEKSGETSPSEQVEDMEEYNTRLFELAEELKGNLEKLNKLADKGVKLVEKAVKEGIGTEGFLVKYEKIINNIEKLSDRSVDTVRICGEYEAERERLCSESEEIAAELLNDDSVEVISGKISRAQGLISRLYEDDNSYEEKIEIIEEIYKKINDIGTLSELSGGKETNPKELLQYVKDVVNNGILGAVVDDVSQISNLAVNTEDLISASGNGQETEEADYSTGTELSDKVMYIYYLSLHFGDYTNILGDTALSYELEYILSGKSSDKDNLTKAVEKIILIREIFNMQHLLTDSVKRNEAYEMALAFTGAVGLPALAAAAQGIILAAWALAEAVVDVQNLLDGGKTPLIKTRDTWNLSLSEVLSVGERSAELNKKEESGLTYKNYIQIMLLFQNKKISLYRMMDLIELNMQSNYNSGFQLSECILSYEFTAEYDVDSVFAAFPVVKNLLGLSSGGYKIGNTVAAGY